MESARFPELDAVMERVWQDVEDLARRGIHLLGSHYDEHEGQWIQFEVVTTDGSEAEGFLHQRYSDLIRIDVVGESLTEEHPTPWQTYRTDDSGRTVFVRYETSGYHQGARAEVCETLDSVMITVIETRSVGAYHPVLMHKEQEVRLGSRVGGRRIVDGSHTTRAPR